MLLGIKSKKIVFLRHLFVAGLSALLVYLFYISYPQWGVDHALWRAFAHAAFVFLFLALILGPATKLWHPLTRFISWRREFGIWFAVLALAHGYVIWDRWARWDVMRLFGFEHAGELGGYILFRPEVGIMNMMGLMVLPMIILLAVTSFDRAVSFLGISSWKWLHNYLVHAIFYIVVLRGVLYLFFFFQLSYPRMIPYPPVWFLYPFIAMAAFAVLLQAAAFVKTVLQRRGPLQYYSIKNQLQNFALIGIGILLILPMALVGGSLVFIENRVADAPKASAQPPQNYARTFHMTVRDANQIIHLWMRDIDTAPYFRQTTEIGGSPISHQIYRYGERILYTAKLNESMELVWFKTENVKPEDIGIPGLAGGPGAWAVQYGKGEHQIQFTEKILRVTIHSVEEAIADEVFEIPEDADPKPMTL